MYFSWVLEEDVDTKDDKAKEKEAKGQQSKLDKEVESLDWLCVAVRHRLVSLMFAAMRANTLTTCVHEIIIKMFSETISA